MTVRWWLWDVPEPPPPVPDLLAPPMVLPDDGTTISFTTSASLGHWPAGERAFAASMTAHAEQILVALGSSGFLATEEPGRTEYVPGADGRPVYVPDFATPMRKVPSLADKRQQWVDGTITLDAWLAAVDAASLADLNGLPPAPWRVPWWKRICVRVLTILAGHRR